MKNTKKNRKRKHVFAWFNVIVVGAVINEKFRFVDFNSNFYFCQYQFMAPSVYVCEPGPRCKRCSQEWTGNEVIFINEFNWLSVIRWIECNKLNNSWLSRLSCRIEWKPLQLQRCKGSTHERVHILKSIMWRTGTFFNTFRYADTWWNG